MIHNLQDEIEKLHRKQEASSRGFSDEELMKMIGEVENGEMCGSGEAVCAPG